MVYGDIMDEKHGKKMENVVVKCGVPCGWVIDDPTLGKRRILLGETVAFDPTDSTQLHNLIGVIKIVNSPRVNEVEDKTSTSGQIRHTIRKKFEIVSGLETLPLVIQQMKIAPQEYYPAEVEAIKLICKDFAPFKKKVKTVMIVK